MKRGIALGVLFIVIFASGFGLLHSFSSGHMAHMDGCVFTFGGSPECITSIVGSLMRADDILPTISLLLFLASIALVVNFFSSTLSLPSPKAFRISTSPPRSHAHGVYAQALARGIIHPKKYA